MLELLQVAGQAGGLGFSQTSATVRLVCAGWKAVHDALVTRLVLRQQTTDEAMGMLVLRFPAVASLEVKESDTPLGWLVALDPTPLLSHTAQSSLSSLVLSHSPPRHHAHCRSRG